MNEEWPETRSSGAFRRVVAAAIHLTHVFLVLAPHLLAETPIDNNVNREKESQDGGEGAYDRGELT